MKISKVNLLKYFVLLAASIITFAGGLFLFGTPARNVLAADGSVDINSTNFPDDTFRAIVSQQDTNHNGKLEKKEIEYTMNIYCEYSGIKSLKGVEYFTSLQGLWCRGNDLDYLDVTNLKDLRGLWCSENPRLSSIDLSQNKELVWVYCFDCNLSALDVTHNEKMAYIECNTNPITSLDLSHNPELEHLTCGTCKLKTLDLSNNTKLTHLDAFQNKFTSLDLRYNTKLKRLDINSNTNLKSIDVSMLPDLQYLNVGYTGLKKLNVKNNPHLNKLNCAYNSLESLDLSNNPELVYLDCNTNGIKKLDLSANPRLRFLQAFINDFTTLNIGNNPYLIKTYNEGVWQDESDFLAQSWTIDYGGEDSTGGDGILFLCVAKKVKIKATPTKDWSEIYPPDNQEDVIDPSILITREAFISTLYNMAGRPAVSGKSKFTDVPSGAWFEDAVIWGEKNSLCMGYPYITADTFGAGKYIRRQDVVFMLMRYSEVMGYKRSIDFGRSDDYLDYYEIDFDHWEAMCWSCTYDILLGKGAPGAGKDEQRIDPLGRATIEDCEYAIRRVLEINGVSAPKKLPYPDPAPIGDPDQVRNFVSRFYVYILGRDGEEAGIADWTHRLLYREATGCQVAQGFVFSPEFVNKNVSDSVFVQRLYKAFFDRGYDLEGYNHWMEMIAQGYTREQILAGFVNSQEFRNLCSKYGILPGRLVVLQEPQGKSKPYKVNPPQQWDASEVNTAKLDEYVERLYTKILKRPSEAPGKEYWRNVIIAGQDPDGNAYDAATAASRGFFNSIEYIGQKNNNEQFVLDCYLTFLNRDPRGTADEANYNDWVKQLDDGRITRDYMIEVGFGCSEEFKKILISYGFKWLG
ncbi:MAG: DUF4214 domain-containing protein [Lachnospiraceae bacterium]|nr:DUF4214 domain-containing protein [Lachnospiraceae bacterium]